MNKLKKAVQEFQRCYILKSVKENYGNITITAKRMGIHRNTLLLTISKLNIRKDINNIQAEIDFIRSSKIRRSINNNYKKTVGKFERKYVKQAIKEANGNLVEVGRILGINRNTVLLKVHKYKLQDYIEKARWRRRKTNKVIMRYYEVYKPSLNAGQVDGESRILGKRIKEARLKAGLSQYRLAKEAGVHQAYLSYTERGMKKLNPGQVERIDAVLGVRAKECYRKGRQ